MLSWAISLFAVGVCAQLLLRHFGHRIAFYSRANFRRKKSERIPLVGGLGLILTAWVGVAMTGSESAKTLLLAALPMICVALIDDKFELSAKIKLPFQILSAALFCHLFGTENLFYSQLAGSEVWGTAISIFFLVVMINAYNFLDGLDGQLATISLIGVATLGFLNPQNEVLSLILTASLASFFIFNFPPAKIYLGEVGSSFLGFALGAFACTLPLAATPTISFWAMNFLFSLAFCDVWSAIFRRLLRKQAPWRGDREHFHHKLELLGFGKKAALMVSASVMLLSSAVAYVAFKSESQSLVLVTLAIGGFGLCLVYFGVLILEKVIAQRTAGVFKFFVQQKLKQIPSLLNLNPAAQFIIFDYSVYVRQLQDNTVPEISEIVDHFLQVFQSLGSRVYVQELDGNRLCIQVHGNLEQSLRQAKQEWRNQVCIQIKNFLTDLRILRNEAAIPEGLKFVSLKEAQLILNRNKSGQVTNEDYGISLVKS
jgi:UDP-GlcNAc:undecaprenyl-phosphate GlcNAc-1-phosphate transferase